MTGSLPSLKPRAFTKWLDTGATPVAAVDRDGTLQFYSELFETILRQAPEDLFHTSLKPPAEIWDGLACYRQLANPIASLTPETVHYRFALYVPLRDAKNAIYGCLITLYSDIPHNLFDHGKPANVALDRADSDALQQQLHEFRQRWSDLTQLDILCGTSAKIRRTSQQVQLAIATNTPVLIRGVDVNACHDLAKGIWLQRFKRAQISSAGFQFMPISPRSLDGEMLQSLLDTALPIRFHGDFIETCLLLEDISSISTPASHILAQWLSLHHPSQIFATETISSASVRLHDASLVTIQQYVGVLVIDLPSLKDRTDDIVAIATRILNQNTTPNRISSLAFSPSAQDALLTYPWHGDLTELRSSIKAIQLPQGKHLVNVADLPMSIRTYIGGMSALPTSSPAIDLDQALLDLEKSLIETMLQESRGNRAAAARKLGISRARLLRRLAQLGIATPTDDETASDETPATSPAKPKPSTPAKTDQRRHDQDVTTPQSVDDMAAIDFVPVDDDEP